jgi:hypothetical protein
MRFYKTVPYRFAPLDVSEGHSGHEFVCLIKGTFSFAPGEPARAVPEKDQAELAGDTPHMDDIGRSLRYATDLVAYKPWAEITLTADCCAPRGVETTESRVWLEAGPISKALVVTGDRVWVHGRDGHDAVDGPLPFTRVPLRWERAFGGLAHPENPLGRGMDIAPDFDGMMRLYLPNIEDPSHRVTSREDRPEPVGFAPVPAHAASRMALQGTRDQRWALFRAPLPPLDYDPCAEQAAPRDQWLEEFWRGDEVVRLGGMDPDHEVIETALPGTRPRLFLDLKRSGPRQFVEIPVVLDTVHIDVAERRLVMVWRRAIRLETPDATEIDAIYLTEEPAGGERLPVARHHDDYLAMRGPDPEPRELQLEKGEAAAIAEARKTLEKANFDPAFLKAFDETKTAQAKLDLVLDLVRSKTTELERMASALRSA